MKLFNAVTVLSLALTGLMIAPTVRAYGGNRKAVDTFSAPVEIPGFHLVRWGGSSAGTGAFKILDSQSDRYIVQIFSKHEKTVYATILAIPNYRLQATDKTAITFSERPAGQPEALRKWFDPGRNSAKKFGYPAIERAKATNTPVLFTAVDIPLEVTEPIKLSVDAPVVTRLKRTGVRKFVDRQERST